MELLAEAQETPVAVAPTLALQLVQIAEDLRALKRHLRTPPAERGAPPATHFRLGLHAAKRRATLFHLALAARRGRLHLRVWHGREVASLEQQAALLAEELARLPPGIIAGP